MVRTIAGIGAVICILSGAYGWATFWLCLYILSEPTQVTLS